jgi:disulfide bond formation protein DsbB
VTPDLSRALNIAGLFAVAAVLAAALFDQLVYHDLPCPLCLLQRAGFVAAAAGLALNVRFGPRPSHYGIVLLSAVAGAAVSIRQMLLHIAPGSGSYGDVLLGLHFYTWAFLIFAAIIVGSAAMLLFDRQFEPPRPAGLPWLGRAAIGVAALLALANGVSTVLECGAGLCEGDPTVYELLEPAAPAAGG